MVCIHFRSKNASNNFVAKLIEFFFPQFLYEKLNFTFLVNKKTRNIIGQGNHRVMIYKHIVVR